MFMKNIRGTPAYWKSTLLDLLAMFRCLGPPTLLMTFSANDMHWLELIMQLTGWSYDEARNYGNAISIVKKDPLIFAIAYILKSVYMHY